MNTYLSKLFEVMDWALAEERESWKRTLETVGDTENGYQLKTLIEVKKQVRAEAMACGESWIQEVPEDELFDINTPAKELWLQMICGNQGNKPTGRISPTLPFVTYLPSSFPHEIPLLLIPCEDGWGIEVTAE